MKTKEPWTLNDRNMGLPTSVGHSFANVDAFIALASVCGASSTKAQRLPLLPIPLVYYSEQGQGRSKGHREQNTDSILGSSMLDPTP
ncbi:hypothetical protein V1478_017013 [Vespula squamosa]|uniref:Uncharacterized protein n=1 Tax=Vespula squamosa TaxID=30214 RepID=A0ABD2A0T6_VESSQ